MSRGRKIIPKVRKAAKKPAADASSPPRVTEGPIDFAVRYAEACGFAIQSKNDEARQIYLELDAALACAEGEVRLRALVQNDLAALAAMEGRFDEALAGWRAAVEIDPDCLPARLNRDLIEAELSMGKMGGDVGELRLAPAPDASSPQCSERWPAGPDGGANAFASGTRLPSFNAPPPLAPPSQGAEILRGAGASFTRSAAGNADPHLPFGLPLPQGGVKRGRNEFRVRNRFGRSHDHDHSAGAALRLAFMAK